MELEVFKKLPLGGLDRRALVSSLASQGLSTATALLAEQRAAIPAHPKLPDDVAVVILGGSNGLTRALALELVFGAGAAVYGVHYDSEKMQIGAFHVKALEARAAEEGRRVRFWNEDAVKPQTIDAVVAALVEAKVRAVHLVNGIAAGATKRYAQHGPTQVKDLDVAFHPILQTPDFSKPENIRKVGLVDVEVATELDIERTNKFMGTSSLEWAEKLAAAGLLARGESVVAFCDYDYPPDDPVYAMGPLAGAKILQRESMATIAERFGARPVRICYPAVATTALGAIPGGLLMYGLSAQILLERGQFRDVTALGRDTMRLFAPGFDAKELRLDEAYQAALPEFHRRKAALGPGDLPGAFARLF